jgi:hypothetical protein
MVHKVALLIGGIGAAAVLALGLALGGFVNAGPVAADNGLAGLGGVSPDPSASPEASPEATDAGDKRLEDVQTIYVEGSSGPNRGPGGGDDDRGPDADDRRGRDEDADDLPVQSMDDFDDDDGFDTHTGTNGDTGTHGGGDADTGTHGGDADTGTHGGGADTRGGTRTNTGGHD